MNVKKTSTIKELQEVMKQDMDSDEKSISKKEIKKIMNEFVEEDQQI